MALLKILEFPDPKLRQRASEVTVFDNTLKTICEDMIETMYNAKGIGLAAIQVNILKRIVVIDLSEEKNNPLIFVNPEIIKISVGTKQHGEVSPAYYESLTEALAACLSIKDWVFFPKELLPNKMDGVSIQVKLMLNHQAFPRPISILASSNQSWQLSSGWVDVLFIEEPL